VTLEAPTTPATLQPEEEKKEEGKEGRRRGRRKWGGLG